MRVLAEFFHPEKMDGRTVLVVTMRDGYWLEDAERQLIEAALARHSGRRIKTVELLGMGRRTLDMKLADFRTRKNALEAPG